MIYENPRSRAARAVNLFCRYVFKNTVQPRAVQAAARCAGGRGCCSRRNTRPSKGRIASRQGVKTAEILYLNGTGKVQGKVQAWGSKAGQAGKVDMQKRE